MSTKPNQQSEEVIKPVRQQARQRDPILDGQLDDDVMSFCSFLIE